MSTFTTYRRVLCEKCGRCEWVCTDWRTHTYMCGHCGHRQVIEP